MPRPVAPVAPRLEPGRPPHLPFESKNDYARRIEQLRAADIAPRHTPRGHPVQVVLRPDTYEWLTEEAEECGLSRSALVQSIIASEAGKPTPRQYGAPMAPRGTGLAPRVRLSPKHATRLASAAAKRGVAPAKLLGELIDGLPA